MPALLALALLAAPQTGSPPLGAPALGSPVLTSPGSPGQGGLAYVYRPVVGAKAVYSVRFFIQGKGQRGTLDHTLTMETLSVGEYGTAHVRLTPSDAKTGGMAKDQPFEFEPYEVDLDPYGRFVGSESMSDQKKLLAVGFALPNVPVAERTWTEVEDPLAHGLPGMTIETTIKSKRGDRVVLLSRNKTKVDGQSFTRETTFDAKSGQLISMRMRGQAEGGISVGMDLDRKETKR